MTGFLASVATVGEMETARLGGADIVDLKDPAKGALGAWNDAALREAVARWRGWGGGAKPMLSATIGDQPMIPETILGAASRIAAAGTPMVKLGVFEGGDPVACLEALRPLTQRAALIAVFFADRAPDFDLLETVAAAGFRGAMVDTADKASGGLRRNLDDAALSAFVRKAQSFGLMTGLAGSLGFDDVAPLARLKPDYLGFRGALCEGGRTGALNPAAVARIAGELRDRRAAA